MMITDFEQVSPARGSSPPPTLTDQHHGNSFLDESDSAAHLL